MKQGYTGNYMGEGKSHAVREDTIYQRPYGTYGDTVCGRTSVNVASRDFNPKGDPSGVCQRCVQIIEAKEGAAWAAAWSLSAKGA